MEPAHLGFAGPGAGVGDGRGPQSSGPFCSVSGCVGWVCSLVNAERSMDENIGGEGGREGGEGVVLVAKNYFFRCC